MDELDREEFYRLKKVQEKKQNETAKLDAEMKLKQRAEQDASEVAADEEPQGETLVADQEDDVIF